MIMAMNLTKMILKIIFVSVILITASVTLFQKMIGRSIGTI